MGEAFYQYGCMLLLLDMLIIGPVREKLIISYCRYKGGMNAVSNINEVVGLCKSTGYLPPKFAPANTKKIKNYPDNYLCRFPIKGLYSFKPKIIFLSRVFDIRNNHSY